MDIANMTLHIKATNETFSINVTRTNHWTLPIQKRNILQQAHKLVLHVDILDMEKANLRKHIKKKHKNLAHKSKNSFCYCLRWQGKIISELRKLDL